VTFADSQASTGDAFFIKNVLVSLGGSLVIVGLAESSAKKIQSLMVTTSNWRVTVDEARLAYRACHDVEAAGKQPRQFATLFYLFFAKTTFNSRRSI
jgi:hypothetical protein